MHSPALLLPLQLVELNWPWFVIPVFTAFQVLPPSRLWYNKGRLFAVSKPAAVHSPELPLPLQLVESNRPVFMIPVGATLQVPPPSWLWYKKGVLFVVSWPAAVLSPVLLQLVELNTPVFVIAVGAALQLLPPSWLWYNKGRLVVLSTPAAVHSPVLPLPLQLVELNPPVVVIPVGTSLQVLPPS